METLPVEVYSEQSNHAVVRMRGRNFPGAVIQGDSLSVLCSEAKEISNRLKAMGCADEELLHVAQEHQSKLLERLLHYQQVLLANGLPLPYSQAATPQDYVALIADGENHAL